MKVWYNVEIQMLGENEMTDKLTDDIIFNLGCRYSDIDEREIYNMTTLFNSNMEPSEMRKYVTDLLHEYPQIFYIDVIYRYDSENVPDRFVIWGNGRVQEYTGHIVFEEDK